MLLVIRRISILYSIYISLIYLLLILSQTVFEQLKRLSKLAMLKEVALS